MKKYVFLLLTLAFLLQPFYRLWIVLAFEINHDFISSTLCEQRDVPDNDCRGYCYLCKRLSEADQCQKQVPLVIKLIEVQWCTPCQHGTLLPYPLWRWCDRLYYSYPAYPYTFEWTTDILDPPEDLDTKLYCATCKNTSYVTHDRTAV